MCAADRRVLQELVPGQLLVLQEPGPGEAATSSAESSTREASQLQEPAGCRATCTVGASAM